MSPLTTHSPPPLFKVSWGPLSPSPYLINNPSPVWRRHQVQQMHPPFPSCQASRSCRGQWMQTPRWVARCWICVRCPAGSSLPWPAGWRVERTSPVEEKHILLVSPSGIMFPPDTGATSIPWNKDTPHSPQNNTLLKIQQEGSVSSTSACDWCRHSMWWSNSHQNIEQLTRGDTGSSSPPCLQSKATRYSNVTVNGGIFQEFLSFANVSRLHLYLWWYNPGPKNKVHMQWPLLSKTSIPVVKAHSDHETLQFQFI